MQFSEITKFNDNIISDRARYNPRILLRFRENEQRRFFTRTAPAFHLTRSRRRRWIGVQPIS
jgi:hypothetical protein